jgi:hypothetical protein
VIASQLQAPQSENYRNIVSKSQQYFVRVSGRDHLSGDLVCLFAEGREAVRSESRSARNFPSFGVVGEAGPSKRDANYQIVPIPSHCPMDKGTQEGRVRLNLSGAGNFR